MSPLADRPLVHRTVGALVAMAAALLAMAASAAIQPRVDNPHGGFKEDCQLCHSSKSWQEVKISSKFDHAKYGFALTGAHATSNCAGCHVSPDFSQARTQCASCHTDPHRGEMGSDCARCHGARNFLDRGPMVRAHQSTRFPLTGGHAPLDCESCHKPTAQGRMQFVGTSLQCFSCHRAQFSSAPNHVSGGFSTECQTCHTPVSWSRVGGFDHTGAGFPLTGRHAMSVRQCADCHAGGYSHTSADCFSCHATSTPGYSTASPPHSAPGFPTSTAACIGCHPQANATHTSWSGAASFDHAAAGFPLSGLHSSSVRACADCHATSGYNPGATNRACESCHTTSTPGYNNPGAGAPAHNTTYFPYAQCTTCHAPAAASFTSWAGGTYTHATMQLTNAHAARACEDCHKGNYLSVALNCYGCHQTPSAISPNAYANATNPPHTPASFPTSNAACQGCHTTTAWQPSTWPANHSTTAFAAGYTGAHLALACTDCHNAATWNVLGTGNNCYGCHATDYAAAANPRHDATNYPTAGCTCHTTTAWSPATGHDHTAAGFPLNGMHSLAARQCADCHATSGYNPGATNRACESCHTTSTPGYNNPGAGAPAHNTTYFPYAQCTTCHAPAAASFTSWAGGTYTHATMQLTNAHAARACEDCHKGNYLSVALNCYGCHQTPSAISPNAYANATNPPHTPASFPTSNAACQGCHTTTAWQPSTWPANHSTTAFAAGYTGAHLALACTDCHNAATWNVLGTGNNCYGCHATDYAAAANPRHDATNYPTAGCTCHTTTAWSPATGHDHTAAGFPLNGMHSLAARQCADCHATSGYNPGATSMDCYSCHATAYNTTVVKHTAPNFPSTTAQCVTCHATANTGHTTWAGGTFANHAAVTTSFALSGNHGAFQCSDCHTSAGTDLTQYTCSVSCHSSDSRFTGHGNASCAGTTFSAAKAVATIKACYSCHPRGTSSSICGG